MSDISIFMINNHTYKYHICHICNFTAEHIPNFLFFSSEACGEAELDADKELQNLTFTAIIPAYPEASVQLPHKKDMYGKVVSDVSTRNFCWKCDANV